MIRAFNLLTVFSKFSSLSLLKQARKSVSSKSFYPFYGNILLSYLFQHYPRPLKKKLLNKISRDLEVLPMTHCLTA